MGGAGDFLAGLLGGLGETYGAAMLEKRRIDLTKKQLEQQNRQFEMQLAATKENTAAQMSLQERLATRGMDIDEKKMYYQGRMQLIMQQMDAAQRRGDIKLHAQLQKDLMGAQWALGQIDADRSVERDVSRANRIGEGDIGRKARIIGMEEASRRRLMHTEAAIRDASSAKDLTLQGQIQRQGQLFNFLTTTLQHKVERGEIEEDQARELKDKILLMSMNAEQTVPGSGARVHAFAQTLLDDISESRASGQISSFQVDAARLLDMEPKAAVAELMKSFEKPTRADSRPTGKGKPTATGVSPQSQERIDFSKGVTYANIGGMKVKLDPNYEKSDEIKRTGPWIDKWIQSSPTSFEDYFGRWREKYGKGESGDIGRDVNAFKDWLAENVSVYGGDKFSMTPDEKRVDEGLPRLLGFLEGAPNAWHETRTPKPPKDGGQSELSPPMRGVGRIRKKVGR